MNNNKNLRKMKEGLIQMKYYDIQGVPQKCSQLIMGSDFFKPETIDYVSEVLQYYKQIGGNTIDTAHVYSGGESEKTIGIWMETEKNRKDVIILTKGAHHNKDGPRVTAEAIKSDLFTSLERLRTDYVEMYGLHRDDPTQPVGLIIEALNEHIEAGRIMAIGGSNWSHQRLQEANDYAKSHGLVGFTFSSPNLSLAKPNEPFWAGCVSADDETCAWHENHAFPLLSWSSQARGFFTGRFTPDVHNDPDVVRVFYSDQNWERFRRAEQLGKEKGVSTIQIALAYVLNQRFPSFALIGARNEAEMQSCSEATEIQLSSQEMDWLNLK